MSRDVNVLFSQCEVAYVISVSGLTQRVKKFRACRFHATNHGQKEPYAVWQNRNVELRMLRQSFGLAEEDARR